MSAAFQLYVTPYYTFYRKIYIPKCCIISTSNTLQAGIGTGVIGRVIWVWPDWVHKVTTQHFGNHTEAKLNLGMFAYIENMEIRQGVCMCITDVSILRNRQLLHPNENMVLRKLTPKKHFQRHGQHTDLFKYTHLIKLPFIGLNSSKSLWSYHFVIR